MTPSEPSRTERPDNDSAGDRRVLNALDAAVRSLGGSPRQGQTTMAQEVAQSLADGTHLLVQAGTGTGKSLGYLVPAMVHAVQAGHRVVVSTATLALQRQILTKDAPLAADAVEQVTGTRPEVALLKGWQNYLCRHRLDGGYPQDEDESALFGVGDAIAQPAAGHGSDASLGEQVVRLRQWAARTDTGDRDDLVPGVSQRAWAQVSVSRAECLGQSCPLKSECFPELARAAASRADLVVTNHAMLGVVVAGNPGVLPDHRVLIVDEAHELADRIRSQGTIALSAAAVARTAATARKHASVLVSELESAGQTLQLALAELPDGRLEATLPTALHDALVLLAGAARQVASDVRDQARTLGRDRSSEAAGGLAVARTAVGDLVDALDRMTSDSVAQGRDVAWIERPRMGAEPPRLLLAPIEVAGSVAGHLLDGRAGVMTSATLALGDSFEPMARSLGLTLAEQPWRGLDVGSPFDYPHQGILYVAAHLPA
ncbi:ATP-dependent helicase, partial [Actinomyces oris]